MRVRLLSYKLGFQALNDNLSLNFELTVETLYLKRKKVVNREIGPKIKLSEYIGEVIVI